MPTPFLYLLPSTARLAYPFILSGVKRGLSSRAIEQTIRAAGLRISRSGSILPMMRELKKLEQQSRNVRYVAKTNVINVNKLPESITRLRRNYSYNVSVKGFDNVGNVIDRFITVSTDSDQITPDEIEHAAREIVDNYQTVGVEDGIKITIEGGLRQSTLIEPL